MPEDAGRTRLFFTFLFILFFVVIAARDIGRPFWGLHSWEDANAAWSARSHLSYGLGYTHGFPTLAVGQPPPAPPPRYLDHPPLPSLLDAAVMGILGRHEWSLRLAALLVTAGALPLLIAILRRLYDDATALLATLVYILFPITGYFYSAPTMWSWMVPFVYASWWCYLALIGALREAPSPGRRHLVGLGVCLFAMIQLGWLGVFYAAGIGTHYVVHCLGRRRLPDARLFAVLLLCPLASLVLVFGALLAARGWDVHALVGLFTWRTSVTGERNRTLAPWFVRQWTVARSNFSLPVLAVVAGYFVALVAAAVRTIAASPSTASGSTEGVRSRPARVFVLPWLFLFPAVSYMAVFREQFWVHEMVYIPYSVPLATACALGLLWLRDRLAERSRAVADAVVCAVLAAIVGFCAHGLNIYHATRWMSPVEIRIMKLLAQRMAPDESLLTYTEYWIADNPYKITHMRPEIAWYLDRSTRAVPSIDDLDRALAEPSARYPFYLVDLAQAPPDLVESLRRRYPFEFFQGTEGETGPPGIKSLGDQLLFDLRGGRRDTSGEATPAAAGTMAAPPSAPDVGALMKTGLHALYEENDPAKAAPIFGQVLAINPRHYGATFQLARALDGMGQREAAREIWKRVLQMAEGDNDAETAGIARTRLLENP